MWGVGQSAGGRMSHAEPDGGHCLRQPCHGLTRGGRNEREEQLVAGCWPLQTSLYCSDQMQDWQQPGWTHGH